MERQFALTRNGELVPDMDGTPIVSAFVSETPVGGYRTTLPPDCTWLPIRNADTEPFDPQRHYRDVPPTFVMNGQEVLRLYRVIPQEAAR